MHISYMKIVCFFTVNKAATIPCICVLGSEYNTSIKNNRIKLKDEVEMAVPKSTQTRFVGITYHTHYIHPYACTLY